MLICAGNIVQPVWQTLISFLFYEKNLIFYHICEFYKFSEAVMSWLKFLKNMRTKIVVEHERIIRLFKEGSWIVVGQIASVIGMLALVRVLTEFLSPAQYGQLALGLTVVSLVTQVVMGGISNGLGRFYSVASQCDDLSGYISDSQRLMAYASVVVVVIGMVMVVGLHWFGYSQWVGLTIALLIFSIFSGYQASLSGVQNAARQRHIVAIHNGLNSWLKFGFVVGALLWFGASSVTVVVGYVFATLLVTISQLYFFRRTISRSVSVSTRHRPWMREIWRFSWPFSLFGVFTWMQQVSDRWSLQVFATAEDVGRYAVVFQLGYTPIATLLGMAMIFIGPILYQRSGNATDDTRNKNVHYLSWKITVLALMLTCVAFFATMTMHEWIFRVLVASEYHSISYLLPWVTLAGGIFACGQLISLKLMSEMKTRMLIAPKTITSLFGVAINIVGASMAGLHGVVIALNAFSLFYFLWMLILAYKGSSDLFVD